LQWKYQTAVDMMSYLQNSTLPDISMAVHQMAHFLNQPMLSHKKAIMCIGWYLLDTCSHGVVYKPDTTKELEGYVDADFASGWSQVNADNAENVLLHTG
jgi:hypothetical protein